MDSLISLILLFLHSCAISWIINRGNYVGICANNKVYFYSTLTWCNYDQSKSSLLILFLKGSVIPTLSTIVLSIHYYKYNTTGAGWRLEKNIVFYFLGGSRKGRVATVNGQYWPPAARRQRPSKGPLWTSNVKSSFVFCRRQGPITRRLNPFFISPATDDEKL